MQTHDWQGNQSDFRGIIATLIELEIIKKQKELKKMANKAAKIQFMWKLEKKDKSN